MASDDHETPETFFLRVNVQYMTVSLHFIILPVSVRVRRGVSPSAPAITTLPSALPSRGRARRKPVSAAAV